MTEEITQRLSIEDIDPLHLLGREDCNLRLLEERFKARIVVRNGFITLTGAEEEVKALAGVLHELVTLAREGRMLEEPEILYAVDAAVQHRQEKKGAGQDGSRGAASGVRPAGAARPERIVYHLERLSVSAKSPGQAAYMAAIEENDIVFSIGPAGTGKTYLAVAAAVNALKTKCVERILLVRPAVEAGESLGFLPGGYEEKVNPYMRPLHDALREMLSFERTRRLVDLGVIEIAPLAYMRGRTLSNSFVILDEGQNTTLGQMKMFLTRLGANSKAVVTGDITQVDLTDKTQSGLILVQDILSDIRGIKFIYLSERDVVRHRLVKAIIKAFEEREKKG